MITTCFGLARKTGNHQTEITGNHAPKQLVTMDRNGWSSWSEIRTPGSTIVKPGDLRAAAIAYFSSNEVTPLTKKVVH